MPLVHPFRTSFGKEEHKQAILVKITDEDGNTGWGETSVSKFPGYCYETIQTAWHIQTDFLLPIFEEAIAKNDIFSLDDIHQQWDKVRGHEFAKAGIESALLCLKAEQDNMSLKRLYGATKSKIPTGVSIGIQNNIKELIDRIQSFIEKGYQRIKMKIEPGWDSDVIKAVRKEFGDIKLMVDANSAFSLSKAHVDVMKQLDKYQLMMIEQPLDYHDMLQHKELQAQISTPICLDESIHNLIDAQLALEYECCKIINIKPGRVGGYETAIEIAKTGGEGKVWCGGMLETGIGRMHNIYLQARPEFTIPGDTSGSDRYFEKDIISPQVKVNSDGFIEVPDGKGLGVEVDEVLIEKYLLNSHVLRLNT